MASPSKLAPHHDEVERLYFEEGESYREIAERFGASREAVRQFLNRNWPGREAGREFRRAIREGERQEREATEAAAEVADAPRCVVCGDPVLRGMGGRGPRKTCSTEHSKLWAQARFLLDPGLRRAQRISMAQSILRYAEEKPESQVRWARKLLAGEHINERTYTIPGSKAAQAYEEVMRIRSEKGRS